MTKIEMVMPKMGESIMEATVLSWLKNEGDTIEADESILEVATDKVDTEVPTTHSGILSEILAKDGEVVPVGQTIAIIEAMKLFNEIESEVSGTIVKVMVENASPVEYDQVLFLVDPS